LLDNDEDGLEGDVWDADTGRLGSRYKGVLGASAAQQVIRKNSEAWRSFFENEKAYHDESNTSVTEHRASVVTKTMGAFSKASFARMPTLRIVVRWASTDP